MQIIAPRLGDVGNELGIPASTLSHHLEKLKNENLVKVRREGIYLWYSANTEALQELLGFLYAMPALARENQRKAGVENAEFLKGEIENIPLPDNSVDVVIPTALSTSRPIKTGVAAWDTLNSGRQAGFG